MQQTTTKASERRTLEQVRFLTITAVGTALVYVFTAFINVRLPISINGGLIHLGNVPLFLFAIIFGKKAGAIAGGIGMGLFDLLSPYAVWAPFTLIIAGCMGWVTGWITETKKGIPWYTLAMGAACVIKVAGYYIAEGLIYGNWIVPVTSIPGNLVQIGTAFIIVLVVAGPLRRAANKIFM